MKKQIFHQHEVKWLCPGLLFSLHCNLVNPDSLCDHRGTLLREASWKILEVAAGHRVEHTLLALPHWLDNIFSVRSQVEMRLRASTCVFLPKFWFAKWTNNLPVWTTVNFAKRLKLARVIHFHCEFKSFVIHMEHFLICHLPGEGVFYCGLSYSSLISLRGIHLPAISTFWPHLSDFIQ